MLKLLTIALLTGLMSLGSFNLKAEQGRLQDGAQTPSITRLAPYEEETVVFHYHRSDGNYTNWDLWVWGEGVTGLAFKYTNDDDYGKWGALPLTNFTDKSYIKIIIRPGSWAQQTGDMTVQLADYTLQADNAYHLYLINMEEHVYASAEEVLAGRVVLAEFISPTQIFGATNIGTTSYSLSVGDVVLATGATGSVYDAAEYRHEFTITIPVSHTINLNNNYYLRVTFAGTGNDDVTAAVSLAGLFDHEMFVDEATYSGSDLGVTYSTSQSTFKAWAPTTSALKLRIYESGTPTTLDAVLGDDTYDEFAFAKGDQGVWTTVVSGDLHGKYYTYIATNSAGTNEFVDPYARAAGVNGLRGMVVDFSRTDPEGWDDVTFSAKEETEIIPYELHVADLTADDTWNGTEANRKKYLGLIEKGTTYTEGDVTVKTGFDHIKELGVNAVQILPIFDQENDEVNVSFNWGYNPRNYNVLEGAYSSNPYDGLVRIREFKQVVMGFAQEDIRIIMDVVYNHVANISGNSLSKLVPEYYFRYNAAGTPSNASGVGNDTASERIMMSRFMTDSTYFLASEYKLGGYRFDLMGLHTLQAMNALSNKLHEDYREDILIYGEPWDMSSTAMSVPMTLASYQNIDDTDRVGAFSDQIRDAARGGVFKTTDAGFVQVGADKINVQMKNRLKYALLGKIFSGTSDPRKTINYVSCHDNHTLYDKIRLAGKPFDYDEARMRLQAVQAQSFVLLSQGVSFLHAGSDILRSKPLEAGGYDHNSYMSSYEINSLKWDEKIDNLDVFETYQAMIAIKRNIAAFNYATREEIDANVTVEFGSDFEMSDTIIKMTVTGGGKTYVVVFLGSAPRTKINLDGMKVMLDTTGTLAPEMMIEGEYTLSANTTLVLDGNPSTTEGGGLTTGAIIGISLGSAAGVGGIAVALFFLLKRKKVV